MKNTLKNPILAVLIATLTFGPWATAYSSVEDTLPDMGTTAAGTLTIDQEILLGDAFTRQIRASTPLIYDPLLLQYINNLGHKLVKNADSVKTPFKFYLVNNQNINAYAYFGGNVVLHSALFRYSQNESQLASVLAHEISHVTQRHLARMLEDQKKQYSISHCRHYWFIIIGDGESTSRVCRLDQHYGGGSTRSY
ncbi:Putative Zn-dependent protease, contains TPR repeats [Moellerella wisconsensis]|nr:Putative Zn-dependent protease, contains TPR repeats [Moellerella wisconsensis]